jgi:hypothetical protein
VVHAGDFCGLLGATPRLAGQAIVEVDLLAVVDDAQRGATDPIPQRGTMRGYTTLFLPPYL